jgi:hypothetical protein
MVELGAGLPRTVCPNGGPVLPRSGTGPYRPRVFGPPVHIFIAMAHGSAGVVTFCVAAHPISNTQKNYFTLCAL